MVAVYPSVTPVEADELCLVLGFKGAQHARRLN